MADINALRTAFEQIRDEKITHANTATRIGNAFLSLLGLVSTGASDCLSSQEDGTANGIISFLKGLKIGQEGDNFVFSPAGSKITNVETYTDKTTGEKYTSDTIFRKRNYPRQ